MALFQKKQQLSGTGPKKTPTPPPKPQTFFEEKKEWPRVKLSKKMTKASPRIPGTGGKFYTRSALKEILGRELEKLLPTRRFGSYISESDAKKLLRELRREESRARTSAEKLKLNKERRWLEETWGLKGKY